MKYLSPLTDIEFRFLEFIQHALPVFHVVCKVTDSPENRVAIVQK